MKNAIFWYVMPRFGGTYRLHHQGDKNGRVIVFLRSVLRLLVTANDLPNSSILVTLMVEALHSSETSFLTRATLRSIAEDDVLHSHCRENLKSYRALTGWAL
jgi:hypothetical protein